MLRVVERDRITARSQQVYYESLSASLTQLPKEAQRKALPTACPEPVLTELLGKLARAENELASKSKAAESDDPKLLQLASLITNLSAQIDTRREGILAGLAALAKAQASRACALKEEQDRLKKRETELMQRYRPKVKVIGASAVVIYLNQADETCSCYDPGERGTSFCRRCFTKTR